MLQLSCKVGGTDEISPLLHIFVRSNNTPFMMNEEQITNHLQQHGVRPTSTRILVWRTIEQIDYVFALSDLENALPTIDKSTLFRTLTLLCEHSMLHQIPDGSGQHKYCVCSAHDNCHNNCNHVHLKCNVCGKTFCLKNEPIPMVNIPHGFKVEHITYIIEGVCPHCGHKSNGHQHPDCCCHNIENS